MSIYEAIGGAGAVAAVVKDFYRRVLADPALKPYFDGVDVEHLMDHQGKFLTVALGGPDAYRGVDMAQAHRGLRVSGDHFDLVVAHLVDTLQAMNIPQETIDQIGGRLFPLKSQIIDK
jgi:hemoglobin